MFPSCVPKLPNSFRNAAVPCSAVSVERDNVLAITVTVLLHEIKHCLKSEELAHTHAILPATLLSRATKTA